MKNLPEWLIKRTPKSKNIKKLRQIVGDPQINTVCEGARCPNIGECFSRGTMTFMILGDVCTRDCRFCAVEGGKPLPIDPAEPRRITLAVKNLGLNYVVITSVTRDDLPDGGATQFARTIHELRSAVKDIKVEVLIPDLKGDLGFLKIVVDAGPNVINHNVETVPRLYPEIRPQADYRRSLALLLNVKKISRRVCVKSGLMVGLGESFTEVTKVLLDLKGAGCDIVTIGQYIPPSKSHAPVVEYVDPEVFERYRSVGMELGIKEVFAGPFVRSSYQAEEILERV